jgi:phosphonate transport system substrate-binding protein
VQSYAAQYEAMRSGRLHVAGVNTGGNPVAVNCSSLVPFAMMAAPDASNSGFKAPSALLKSEFGLVAERDFKTAFSGKHDNSILGVANKDYKDYEMVAVANSVLNRMIFRGVVKAEQIRSISRSATFPTTGYGHAHNLHPVVTAKILQAFFTFPWEGSDLQ